MVHALLAFLSALILWVAPAAAQELDEPFKPDWLSKEEARYLQTGLTLEGLYVGLIDGDWGRGSQAALDKFMAGRNSGQLRYRDLAPLVQRTQQAIQTDFWQGINDFPKRATFLAPMAILQQDYGSELFTLQSPDNSLKIRLIDNDKDKTIEMHQWLIDNHKGTKQELYQKYTDQRLVTSGVLGSGKTVYLRSEYAKSNAIVTVLVQYEPWQRERGMLVAASINYEGWGIGLALPDYSPLARLLEQPGGRAARPSEPVKPVTGGGGGGIARSEPGKGGGQQPAQPSQPGNGGGNGGGISRSEPGTGGSGERTPDIGSGGSGGSNPGIGSGGSGGGISRPSAPIAANSQSFSIPALPPANQ
jgi:hypothetical protein